MADDVVRVPADLVPESRQAEAFRALERRFPTLLLCIYGSGVLEQVVVQRGGVPTVLAVENADQTLKES